MYKKHKTHKRHRHSKQTFRQWYQSCARSNALYMPRLCVSVELWTQQLHCLLTCLLKLYASISTSHPCYVDSSAVR